jgi:hypothetical protein
MFIRLKYEKRDASITYSGFDLMGGWYKLLEFCGSLFKSWSRDIGHENIGTFFCEENACLETNSTNKKVSANSPGLREILVLDYCPHEREILTA